MRNHLENGCAQSVRYVGGIEAEPPGEWVCPECQVCGIDRGGSTGRMGVPRVSGMWD